VGRLSLAARPTAGETFTQGSDESGDIAFVLEHYVKERVEQLDEEKLPPLLRLKYGSIDDARRLLGAPVEIRRFFIDFQRFLCQHKKAA
jgi:type I restriction enzyme R subunit